ncbi:MAG TPA: hypothetical protein IGS53_02590 [Leptolyngbyaceae cyanobacterium M33_DOE_097]|uniref:Uncharacterized protein n=1 Tax=Oscillatoriales cyanobacterium SpSt-418 TaxID=2282169 RepID=A0A7C3KE27_9CYAN|nr:hypothetical protein [Leptolyngbyaceae cyanobacterium M33_DOE_097]
MKSKTVEHNSNRLVIVITYQDEQFLLGIFVMFGVAILTLTYLGIASKIPASFMQASDLSIVCYIAGFVVLIYGLFRLYSSFLISKFAFDKTVNRLEVESKYFANTNRQVFRLSEVTGIEEVFKPKTTPELFLWIKKGNEVRGEKILFAKASITSLHILWREVSEFLKDQPNLILSKEWLIEQNKDKFKIYRSYDMFRNPDKRTYTVDKKQAI